MEQCVCTCPCWIQEHDDARVPGRYDLGQVIDGELGELLARDYPRFFSMEAK